MSTNINEFKEIFLKVKESGWIESHRKGNTGIGKTFEDCCDIVENNNDIPDFKDIEIKSQRNYTGSYITLFTKAPTYPLRANTTLRNSYGSPDPDFPDLKILHTSIFANKFNTYKNTYGFKLEVDEENRKILLLVKDLSSDTIIMNSVYWSYEVIKRIIETKLQYIAYITAKVKRENGNESFNFTKMVLLSNFTFKIFIELLKNGYIMFDIRIGAYKTGSKRGTSHDHGSGFRISKRNLHKAFNIETIE